MAYQDRWVRGETLAHGDRACESRYGLIRSVVAEYRRPTTVWDLGANLGYFGCRLADEFGAVAVMVESRPGLADACRQNAIHTTVAMTQRISAQDLAEMAASEHADVVLCLNVLHHMHDWKLALDAVMALGQDIVIETPGRDDIGSASYTRSQWILTALEELGGTIIGWSDSHVTSGIKRPVYRFTRRKTYVSAGYAYRARVRARGAHPPREHHIISTHDEKSVTFVGESSRPWAHGVNLWNWLQMGGSYPDRADVRRMVQEAAETLQAPHGDFRPWNLILQGQSVQVIDHAHRKSVEDADGLAYTLACIDHPEMAYAR